MRSRGSYSRSPLTEALVDLRCRVPEATTLDSLAEIQHQERERYPHREDRLLFQARPGTGEELSASASQRKVGYIFWSGDRRQAFQARLDGFTFSRLEPYKGWETFQAEAHRLWDMYQSAARVEGITRVAVRYINRLDLPLPFDDFKEYLRTVPEVSPELPQALSGLLMRLEIPQPDIEALLLLTEALARPSSEGVASVILDIDLFREYESPIQSDEAWGYLEQLRCRKNEVFEACLTERTRELIS